MASICLWLNRLLYIHISYPAIRNYRFAIATAIFRHGASVVSATGGDVDATEALPCASKT